MGKQMSLQRAAAAVLCAFCMAFSLPALSTPAAADGPAPGEPQVNAPDAHRRQAVWTFPGPAGYSISELVVDAGRAELEINQSTGARAPYGTVTAPEFLPRNLTSWDSIESDSEIPQACRISFSVSTNAGGSWFSVPQNGSLRGTNEATGMIRVRAELLTQDPDATPVLRSIWLSFTVNRAPEILSLNCTKGAFIYKRDQAVINARVVDPDGDPLSYMWSQEEGPDARLGRTDQASLAFTPSDNGPHSFRLSASDGYGATRTANIMVSVLNHPPVISIEMEGTPYKDTPVHLFAGAYSADSSLADFKWMLVSAPPFTTMVQPTKPDIVLHSFCPGECTVSLTVTDDLGTKGTQNITFEFIGRPPKAALTADINDAHAGRPLRFDASRSSDADGDRLQYRFDFGDGETTDWVYFSDIEHVFVRTGSYTVRVRVRDVDGLVSDAQYPVRIKPRNQPPLARIQLTPGNLTTPFLFVSNSEDRDGSIDWTEWDFGDGGTARGAAVSHLFTLPGNYTVRLWVRDDDTEGSSATALININRPPALVARNPPGDFALDPDQGFNLSVEAVDPDGDALSYSWSQNGEQLASETTNAHRFVPGREGSYDITVFVDDGRGGGTNYTWNLTITPRAGPGPQPVYTLLAIIIVALLAQGAYLSVVAVRSRRRRSRERAGGGVPAAGATSAAAPLSIGRPLAEKGPAAASASPPPRIVRSSREMTPPEWTPDIPPPGLPAPDIFPPTIPPPEALPPEATPPEAQPVMEEIFEPEPLAQILGPADRQRPYRRTRPPF